MSTSVMSSFHHFVSLIFTLHNLANCLVITWQVGLKTESNLHNRLRVSNNHWCVHVRHLSIISWSTLSSRATYEHLCYISFISLFPWFLYCIILIIVWLCPVLVQIVELEFIMLNYSSLFLVARNPNTVMTEIHEPRLWKFWAKAIPYLKVD
jgi:hypothetical protein